MIRRNDARTHLPLIVVSADSGHRRTAKLVLAWAVTQIALAIVALVVTAHRDASHDTPPHPSVAAAPAPRSGQSSGTARQAATPPAAAPAAAVSAGSTTGARAEKGPATEESASDAAGSVSAPAVEVSCRPDVGLDASPDAAYSFLCARGATPISWPSDSLRLYTSGLTPAQTAALPIALQQWQTRARFSVTRVDSAADAEVVVKGQPLTNNEDGYTAMHYVCATKCAYDHADVQLASNVELTKTSWISTILHELGHVAGLNHVARHSEVMYPEIDSRSPVLYGTGDVQGFEELAKVRSAS